MDGIFTNDQRSPNKKSVEWYTPKWVFDELKCTFDLDPCSPHDFETVVPANMKYTIYDNGLEKQWSGLVWLNPPYGKETPYWMDKMIEHNNGIALVFSRTDTTWCQKAMRSCSAMLFVSGRINFVAGLENQHKKSRSGAGTVLFAFGLFAANQLENMGDRGIFIVNEH